MSYYAALEFLDGHLGRNQMRAFIRIPEVPGTTFENDCAVVCCVLEDCGLFVRHSPFALNTRATPTPALEFPSFAVPSFSVQDGRFVVVKEEADNDTHAHSLPPLRLAGCLPRLGGRAYCRREQLHQEQHEIPYMYFNQQQDCRRSFSAGQYKCSFYRPPTENTPSHRRSIISRTAPVPTVKLKVTKH